MVEFKLLLMNTATGQSQIFYSFGYLLSSQRNYELVNISEKIKLKRIPSIETNAVLLNTYPPSSMALVKNN